jgi:DNA-binding beta-propeller fold protein YncE
VFDAAGLPLQTITSDLFQEPVDVALAADGSLLVLDALAQQVFRVDEDGGVELTPLQASFYRPRGLAVDAAGNIVVADTGGARVVVMGPDGAPLVEFGGQGSPLGRGQPVDALPGAGALWAISAEDGRLWNLTSDGSLTAIQPSGTVDGPQLAQLSGGRLLASDPARATFTLFSPAGEPLAQFGYVGELQQPTGVAAAPGAEGDVIAVVDTRACAVSFWRLGE